MKLNIFWCVHINIIVLYFNCTVSSIYRFTLITLKIMYNIHLICLNINSIIRLLFIFFSFISSSSITTSLGLYIYLFVITCHTGGTAFNIHIDRKHQTASWNPVSCDVVLLITKVSQHFQKMYHVWLTSSAFICSNI